MKRLIALIALFWCAGLSAAEDEKTAWYVTNGAFSQYLGSNGAVFSEDASITNEITASKGDFYAGVWFATGLGHGKYGKTYKDDWDPYIGWTHSFGDIKYEITATYFLLADFARLNDDLWALDQKISLPKCPFVQPYAKVRSFNKVGPKSFESGWFGWVGFSKICPIHKTKFGFDLSTAYSDGALGKNPGPVYTRAKLELRIPLSKDTDIGPSVVYQVPIGGQQHHRLAYTTKTEVVWGLTFGQKL